jgi:hypothetical protein
MPTKIFRAVKYWWNSENFSVKNCVIDTWSHRRMPAQQSLASHRPWATAVSNLCTTQNELETGSAQPSSL